MSYLENLRAQKEAEAKQYSEDIKRWLEIALITTEAVLRAASRGNVICQEAAKKIAPLLPVNKVVNLHATVAESALGHPPSFDDTPHKPEPFEPPVPDSRQSIEQSEDTQHER